MKEDFATCLSNKAGFKGFGIPEDKHAEQVPLTFEDQEYKLKHGKRAMILLLYFCPLNIIAWDYNCLWQDKGLFEIDFLFFDLLSVFSCYLGSVVIAAITSCTNTSNPSVMLGAGLLAKKAVEHGLQVAPYIKTSLSPGSGVVTYYLQDSGVLNYLEQLGYVMVLSMKQIVPL